MNAFIIVSPYSHTFILFIYLFICLFCGLICGVWTGVRGSGSGLTEQQQLDILGRGDPVLLQVLLDGFAPVQSRPLLCAQGTSHG